MGLSIEQLEGRPGIAGGEPGVIVVRQLLGPNGEFRERENVDPAQNKKTYHFTTERLIKVTPGDRASVILHGLDFAALAVDKAGHIYAQIDTPTGAMLREFSASGTLLETIAGGKGAYTETRARPNFFAAFSLAVEPNGNIFGRTAPTGRFGLVLLSHRP